VARHLLATVDSTNAEGARLAPTMTAPTWILATNQTAGRGRRARAWLSPPGNFFATLVMKTTEPLDRIALRSFAAALALREACVAVTGLPNSFALKWPNDVLLNGGKLAGILLESMGSGKTIHHLAIGIGVNLIAAPDPSQIEHGATPPVGLLAETGHRISPEAFLNHLAPAYARWEAQLVALGFAPLRTEWLSHAARLGDTIRARTGSATHEGRFETIDDHGALILHTSAGRMAIPAADVFF
jgi:BirA family transcriptional regulator, biotin operon repressor / biotin---[acetyl-CoA-carboxylase] ligase